MVRGDFQIVTHPERQPAVDFITRSAQGPFIDTGVDVILRSQPGNPVTVERVYIALDTIKQLAAMFGLSGGGNVFTDERVKQLIATGKLEALKEGLGDELADVGRTLRRWLDDAGIGTDKRRRT